MERSAGLGKEIGKNLDPRLKDVLSKLFGVDRSGSVISLPATSKSLCDFEVDHIFPKSRGGLFQRYDGGNLNHFELGGAIGVSDDGQYENAALCPIV